MFDRVYALLQVGTNVRTTRLLFSVFVWSFFFLLSRDHRYLHVLTHSFPARRSSDLLPTTAFNGFLAVTATVSKTLLVRCDYNKYSVAARALGRPAEVHAYATRIVIRQGDDIVSEHARR